MNIETAKQMVKAQEHIERIERFIEKVPSWGLTLSLSYGPSVNVTQEEARKIARKKLRAAKAKLKSLQEKP